MQQAFTNAYPSKELYFTECAGTLGTDWWSDIKVRSSIMVQSYPAHPDAMQWYFDNL
jgi:hypothetical protein